VEAKLDPCCWRDIRGFSKRKRGVPQKGRGNCSLKIKGDEIMSLKEKAKTGQEIYESIAEHYYHSDRERKELWVRLEDAEQEVKDATETLLARLIPLEQKVSILQKEREELKQKLKHLKEKLEEKAKILCYQCEKCGFIDVTSKEEFEKLPKEQQQYLLRHRQECGGRFIPVKYVLLKDIEEMLKKVKTNGRKKNNL
jgi:seryl-tRNA synthetase